MSTSGFILKKKKYIDTEKTINDIKKIASKLNLSFELCGKKYDKNNNFMNADFSIYNALVEGEGFIFYLSSLCDKASICVDEEYDWIEKGGCLADFLMIEAFDGREKLLLDFLYEYFKLDNEEDYFCSEWYKWYFDFETIKKLKEAPFDKDWPYHRPE